MVDVGLREIGVSHGIKGLQAPRVMMIMKLLLVDKFKEVSVDPSSDDNEGEDDDQKIMMAIMIKYM